MSNSDSAFKITMCLLTLEFNMNIIKINYIWVHLEYFSWSVPHWMEIIAASAPSCHQNLTFAQMSLLQQSLPNLWLEAAVPFTFGPLAWLSILQSIGPIWHYCRVENVNGVEKVKEARLLWVTHSDSDSFSCFEIPNQRNFFSIRLHLINLVSINTTWSFTRIQMPMYIW